MIRCLSCQAETSNGLALCDLCRRAASTYLTYIDVHFANLARWRPGRAGARPVPGSVVLWDGSPARVGTGDRISDMLDETFNALSTWARALADDRPQLRRLLDRLAAARASERITEAEAVTWLCKGFDRYLTSISTLGWAGEFVNELGQHEARLRSFTEQYVPGWYAGSCRQVVGFDSEGAAVYCEAGTYVVPGLSWVTCNACGASTYARDHLETVLNEARGWLAPPKRIAEAVVALVDTEASVSRLYDRIRRWASDGTLDAQHQMKRDHVYDPDLDRIVVADQPVGRARYRLGDVLDLVLRDTRALGSAKAGQAS